MCSYKHSDVHTIPLVIISGGYVRDGAVSGIYITRYIIIDVHHWNSAFQLTTFVYMFYRYIYYNYTQAIICAIRLHIGMTNLWWVGSLLLVLCMVSIALLIVAADLEAFTARLAGSD